MAKQTKTCGFCAGTCILNSSLVREEEGGKHIAVVVCGHHPRELIEKSLIAMHEASQLDIDILSVEKPK
jgi:hypothetical protein